MIMVPLRSALRFVVPAAAVAGLLLLAPVPASANGGDIHDIDVGAYVGSLHPDSYDGVDPDNGTFYGVRGGYFFTPKWSVEGSWQRFSTNGDNNSSVDLNSLRANGLWNFRAGKKFRWFLTLGLGKEKVDSDDLGVSESAWGWNWGGGGRWFFGKSKFWGVRADARWITVKPGGDVNDTQTNYEGTGGIFFTFGGGVPGDADSDGVNDKMDKCTNTPKGAKVDSSGCPKDSDGDHVYDGLDKCDHTPAGWQVDASGCPKDTDGDGVADNVDKCPNTPKEAKADKDGCPIEDEDHDGIWDKLDRCPKTEPGLKVDPVGCPVDEDKDGVWDRKEPVKPATPPPPPKPPQP
jgi:OmpA-OmpF porin, OOP family